MLIVGITGRIGKNEGHETVLAYKALCDILFQYDILPICLIPNASSGKLSDKEFEKLKQMISFCDGIILQGGEQFNDYDLRLTQYVYDEDIPTLGICLGLQQMGYICGGQLLSITNHISDMNYAHYIKIVPNSKLYEIIGKEFIFVNSYHHNCIAQPHLTISAYCGDVIEALEDKNKTFFIGVQWHPEKLFDENTDKLFRAFIKAILQKKGK